MTPLCDSRKMYVDLENQLLGVCSRAFKGIKSFLAVSYMTKRVVDAAGRVEIKTWSPETR